MGAGKTTLLNRLMTGSAGKGVGVVINDFGDIPVDEHLVSGRGDHIVSLANGCVCCDLGENLVEALLRLRAHSPWAIVIEASGVADPGRIAQVARVGRMFRLNAVAVLVDAALVRQHAADRYLGDTILRQIRAADLLVVNKTDLVPDAERAAVGAWLGEVAPGVRQVETQRADLPLDVLLGVAQERWVQPSHDDLGRFVSWSFRTRRPFERTALARVMDGLPSGVLRAKGLVSLHDAPGRREALHLVGRRWQFEACSAEDTGFPASELVLIGIGDFDASAFDAGFSGACERLSCQHGSKDGHVLQT